jgi:hypothetical protein
MRAQALQCGDSKWRRGSFLIKNLEGINQSGLANGVLGRKLNYQHASTVLGGAPQMKWRCLQSRPNSSPLHFPANRELTANLQFPGILSAVPVRPNAQNSLRLSRFWAAPSQKWNRELILGIREFAFPVRLWNQNFLSFFVTL